MLHRRHLLASSSVKAVALFSISFPKVAYWEISEFTYIKDFLVFDHVKAPQSTEQLDKTIKNLCHEMGSSNRNKLRVVFQYLLMKNLGLPDQYLKK